MDTDLAYNTLLFHLVLGLVLLGQANGKSRDEILSEIGTIYRRIDDMLRASEGAPN